MRYFLTEQNEQKVEHKYTATHYMASKAIIRTAWDADRQEKAGSRRCTWHHSPHLRDLWSGYWCRRQSLHVSKKQANVLQAALSSMKHASCQLVGRNAAERQCLQRRSTACCSGFLLILCRTVSCKKRRQSRSQGAQKPYDLKTITGLV